MVGVSEVLHMSGAIALWTPHECRTAGPGDVVMLPKVMPHTWRAYGNDPIRSQVTVTPGEFETNAIFAATGKRLRQLPVDTAALKPV
jgi:hypothetical protein